MLIREDTTRNLPTRVPYHRFEPSHFLDPSARSVRKSDIVTLTTCKQVATTM